MQRKVMVSTTSNSANHHFKTEGSTCGEPGGEAEKAPHYRAPHNMSNPARRAHQLQNAALAASMLQAAYSTTWVELAKLRAEIDQAEWLDEERARGGGEGGEGGEDDALSPDSHSIDARISELTARKRTREGGGDGGDGGGEGEGEGEGKNLFGSGALRARELSRSAKKNVRVADGLMAKKKDFDARMKEMREEKERKEDELMRNKPKINAHSRALAQRRGAGGESMADRLTRQKEAEIAKHQKEHDEREAAEVAEVRLSSTPAINSKSKKV